jgi:hypothetical protein
MHNDAAPGIVDDTAKYIDSVLKAHNIIGYRTVYNDSTKTLKIFNSSFRSEDDANAFLDQIEDAVDNNNDLEISDLAAYESMNDNGFVAEASITTINDDE